MRIALRYPSGKRGYKTPPKGICLGKETKVGEARNAGVLRKVEKRYGGFEVQDLEGDRIGSVDATYINEDNQREYIAVSGGLSAMIPGTSGSNLIPVDICTVDNNRSIIEVSTQKDAVKNSPSLKGTSNLTPEYEAQVRSYYGV